MAIAEPKTAARRPGFTFDALLEQDHSRWPVFVRLVRECILPHWPIVAISIGCDDRVGGDRRRACRSSCRGSATTFSWRRTPTSSFCCRRCWSWRCWSAPSSDWVSTVAEASLGTKIVAELRYRMFDTIAAADLAWIQGNHSGRFVSTFVNDAPIIDRAATRVMVGLFRNGDERRLPARRDVLHGLAAEPLRADRRAAGGLQSRQAADSGSGARPAAACRNRASSTAC